jgi:hypothetical protein
MIMMKLNGAMMMMMMMNMMMMNKIKSIKKMKDE